ncbi:hypothetical protein TSUD_05270 [Trifolium subterraneum]|uniref:serine C-palmitoyltransferase n=1 Tax=Trifolium subterraneum TaxID=3900 RepID=A0A2Z6M549_TRISU|nr:hypothetical protein TSUD_05270 [Trifolium subterraneum]
MASTVMDLVNNTLDWVTYALDAPSARAKSYKPPKRPLTNKEIDELCDEWVPQPLIPSLNEEMHYEPPVLESAAGPHTIINGKEVVNFASANYLGLIGHQKLLDSCSSALEKYGVGSCGPRGFYGTIDVHLDCEARIAKFLGTPDSILYSYGLSTMFSAIPAFSKKGDIIVADEGVHWGIQNGLYLSRSTVNSGQIAPLDEIIKLKEKYLFRILMDESNSFGVLGSSGRGVTEHYGVPVEKLDLITASMGHALATEGGFCTGSARVIDHQRLSSSGYVFSASLPPYLASAAISAIDVLDENPNLLTKLKNNIAVLWKGLSNIPGFTIASHPESPIVYLRLKKSTGSLKDDLHLLENIAERVLKEDSVFVVASKRSTLDKCKLPVGIRLFVSAGHSESDLHKASESLKRVATLVLGRHS